MFASASISTRLFALLGLLVAFSAAVLAESFVSIRGIQRSSVEEAHEIMSRDQREKLTVAVGSMAQALGGIVRGMDPAAARQAIRRALEPVRFEEDASGYFFAYDYDGVNVAHPIRPEFQDTMRLDVTDPEGRPYIRELLEKARSGGGFVEYGFDKPGGGVVLKLAYGAPVPGTPYWLASGVYVDNVTSQMRAMHGRFDSLFRHRTALALPLFALLLVVVTAACLAMARSIVRPLAEATRAAEHIAAGNLDVALDARGPDETARLQAALNRMAATLRRDIEEIDERRRQAEEKAVQAEQAGREALRQISRRIESLRNISQAVAHQLRNPTTIIAGFANLLLKKPGMSERYLDYLDGIVLAARRIEGIAAAVHEYSDLRMGPLQRVPLAFVAGQVRACALSQAATLGVEARAEAAATPGQEVMIDPDLVETALCEIVKNSLEAARPGGVRIDIRAACEAGETVFTVSDDGKGMPPGVLDYVLDPFFTTKAVGVGLGLTKALRAAQEHGGVLEVSSAEGQGATVTMRLPGACVLEAP